MNPPDIIAAVAALISSISAVAAVVSARVSKRAVDVAEKSMEKNIALAKESMEKNIALAKESMKNSIDIFKRQGVIDLYMAWQDIHDIDASNPHQIDVIRAANALDLTAALWNHDVIEKEILFQHYWEWYKHIYDTLHSLGDTYSKYLSKGVKTAYEGMEKMDMNTVRTTRLGEGGIR